MSLVKKSDGATPTVKSVFGRLKQVAAAPPTVSRVLTLVLDCSGSMTGEPIHELNAAVQRSIAEFASKVELRALTFPHFYSGIVPAITVGRLRAHGSTPMGEALTRFACDSERGAHAILMSDGSPTDDIEGPVRMCVEGGLVVHTVACGPDADELLLRDIAARTGGQFYRANEPIKLTDAFLQLGRKAVAALTAGQKELPR